MSASEILSREVRQCLINLKSDKVTVRSKALEFLQHVFENRLVEINRVLATPADEDSLSWDKLYSELHDIVKDQCDRLEACKTDKSLKTVENKNHSYETVLQKCIDSGNAKVQLVKFDTILATALECFQTPKIGKYFGVCYLKIVLKDVLKSKYSLAAVKVSEWSRLLSYVLEVFDDGQSEIAKLDLLQCLALTIKNGAKYAYISDDLQQNLPRIKQIVIGHEHQIRAQTQVISIVYELVVQLSLNHRTSTIAFIEQVLEKLIGMYKNITDTEAKATLFKIFHISIVIHSPNPQSDIRLELEPTSNRNDLANIFKVNHSNDIQLWYKHLRNMFDIVIREIGDQQRQLTRLNSTPTICQYFVRMSAKLCAVIFWNETVWLVNGTDEQQQKRRRHAMKLQRIMELVELGNNRFCWRWFSIMSRMLEDFPYLMDADDYQPMLKLLSEYQTTIQKSNEMMPFISIVRTMLGKEADLKANSEVITESYCTQQWQQIIEHSFKQAATSKIQSGYLNLLSAMIEKRVSVPTEFVKNAITEIIKTPNIKRSNSSIGLLISIMRYANVELVDDITNLKINVINWLGSKVKPSELSRIIENDCELDRDLVNELYALCILSKPPQSAAQKQPSRIGIDENHCGEFNELILQLEMNLNYLTLEKILVVDGCDDMLPNETNDIIGFPESDAIETKIVEAANAALETLLQSDENFSSCQNSMEEFQIIMSSLITYVGLLNKLVSYEALDGNSFTKLVYTKRIPIKIDQLNATVEKFRSGRDLDRNDVNEIVEKLSQIWNANLHPIVSQLIFTKCNIKPIINWLSESMESTDQKPKSFTSKPISSFNELEFEEKVQLNCLKLLAYFSAHEDENECIAFDAIDNYKFNFERNEDLFFVFELVKIIFNQHPTTEKRSDFAFDLLKDVCMNLSKNQDYLELVAENIPALIRSIARYVDMHDDLISLLSSFLKQMKKRAYRQSICIKVIKSIQYFVQILFKDEDCFKISSYLNHFLDSKYVLIQFATVQCLTNIFDKKWLKYEEHDVDCLTVREFQFKLFEELNINTKLAINNTDGLDRKSCILATRLQMYCSLISKCFALRKRIWFDLMELCCHDIEMKTENMRSLCSNAFQKETKQLLEDIVPDLIGMWIERNYQVSAFPYYLTDCSQSNFLTEHAESISFYVLQCSPTQLPELLEAHGVTSVSQLLTDSIVTKCLAYLTPLNVKSSKISQTYKNRGVGMAKILTDNINITDFYKKHSLEIVEQLIYNMWDDEQFNRLFGTSVEYEADESTIDYQLFMQSLEFIQRSAGMGSTIIDDYCTNFPSKVFAVLNRLKLSMQRSVCEELKLTQMFRIGCLIDFIINFIVTNTDSSRRSSAEFFIQDFVYLLGNTISSNASDQLKLAACKYFRKFCAKILPECALIFKRFLNYVVSILMPIAKRKQFTEISDIAMQFLRFLVVEQESIRDAIAILDSFPSQPAFNELREIHHAVKYGGRSFSLKEEIEYFLSVDKRKVEGLLSLKEHLSTKKNELKDIYKGIYDSRGFSEDVEKSLIHRLILALFQTVQSVDMEKSVIAAKCLGELGPGDLGTLILKFDVQQQNYKVCSSSGDMIRFLYECAIEKLRALLLHRDANVLQAVAVACERLLQTEVAMLDEDSILNVFKTDAPKKPFFKKPDEPLNLSSSFNQNAFQQSHSKWIKSLAINLFNLFDCEPLAVVAAQQAQFAEAMVPLLIKVILMTGNASHYDALNEAIDAFFTSHFEFLESANDPQAKVPINKTSIKSMLNIVECVRIHKQRLPSDNGLRLNYLHIAKAASFCGAHFTAILYGDLASYETAEGIKNIEIQTVMKDAYESIGESDAVSAFVHPIRSPTEYLLFNQNYYDIVLRADANRIDFGQYANYLTQFGLYNLANQLTKESDAVKYDCAWRLADWSIIDAGTSSTSGSADQAVEVSKHHYFALKCFKERDEMGVKTNIKKAITEIINIFKQSSHECTKNLYKNLMMLHMLQEIEEFCYIQFLNSDDTTYTSDFVINKWKHQDAIPSSDFCYREPILSQRIQIFKTAGVRAKRKIESIFGIDEGIQEMVLNLAVECRQEGAHALAVRRLAELESMSLSHEMRSKVTMEAAQLHWSRGDCKTAKIMMKHVSEESLSIERYSAIGFYGEYLAQSHSENIKTVIDEYWMKSMKLVASAAKNPEIVKKYKQSNESFGMFDIANRKRNYLAIAKYADLEYQRITDLKRSSDFEKKQTNCEKNQNIIADMNQRHKNGTLNQDEGRSLTILKKFVEIDKSDIKSINDEYSMYLELAFEKYISCLILEPRDEFNDSLLFRAFGLLFANKTNETILATMDRYYASIASYKYLVIMPQITTHLSTNNDSFGQLMQRIVYKCIQSHPHHVLHQIFALANAFSDEEFVGKQGKHKKISSSPRADASQKILQELKTSSKFRPIIEQTEQMCAALISLANTDMGDKREFSSDAAIAKLKNLDEIQCPTVKLPISISGDYKHLTSVVRWEKTFTRPGGINAPKKIECRCSDGRIYPQLLKGKDDIRQDAVMQQVFNIMNDMLGKSKTIKKNRLSVRTYLVVPLSQRSGLIEWCVNTTPTSDYLLKAHTRYRPNDLSPSACRKKLQETPRGTPFDKQLKNYNEICARIQPVFHHFFFEFYHTPGIWFERRMAYAHSLATTSMIGYILGIGDRHVNNILIDKTTAELIHIDFGIAFEQGKCLPSPETIPFRLTRDFVSALGPVGVDGVFRKSSEKTMELLRQNKSTILTIVEVLLNDPLYAWTLTKNDIEKRQETNNMDIDEDEDKNTLAERALIRLEEKLNGKHGGRSEQLAVERHVDILFNEATNVNNLCRLFAGWQAYL